MATAPKFRIAVDIHNLLMDSSREPVRPAAVKGLTLTRTYISAVSGKATRSWTGNSSRKTGLESVASLSCYAGMAFPLYTVARDARRIQSHHRLPVRRIQMQSRLLVLLGLQQQSKRHDRGCGVAVH